MNQILANVAELVNPATIDAALIDAYLADLATGRTENLDRYDAELDAAFDLWMDTHADELAADAEADSMVELGHWAW